VARFKQKRPSRRIRVDVDADPVEIAKRTARELDPTLTDAEIVAGMRDLADRIEAASVERAAV
jgi:hypothetical protein